MRLAVAVRGRSQNLALWNDFSGGLLLVVAETVQRGRYVSSDIL